MVIASRLLPSVPTLNSRRFHVPSRRLISAAPPSMDRPPSEPEDDDKHYVHYNHTIPSKYPRWTPRECFRYFYDRPWDEIRDFYADLVRGNSSLAMLFAAKGDFICNEGDVSEKCENRLPESVADDDRSGRWERRTYKIVVSYHGASFDGWQKQPNLNTVQELVEKSLGIFVDERKAKLLKEKCLPLEGCAVVAGRTDKGVTALRQVCSFYTWRKDVEPRDIEVVLNSVTSGALRVVSVSEVSRSFHPNFSAKWRRYCYLFPFNDGEVGEDSCDFSSMNENTAKELSNWSGNGIIICSATVEQHAHGHENGDTRKVINVSQVNRFLRLLEGKTLSYKMFARDTKASRNTGPPTECFMYHARAALCRLRSSDQEHGRTIMCIELVANRFLRKMVRVLVATSIREAAAGSDDDVLIKLMDEACRRATAPPAPPDGLCLVDVGYADFDREVCFIK
ncbi:hypothetical protein MLD38_005957 [Melastoma candidum]|uniref:Uncharacterized protein n=1 Tax=Melastoma candidum TaxID=119954 RepID=A0ACB9RLD9_9MYRT|nr:hypothetical protein MLD38_005957 [Melastoma candidum]